MADEFRINKEYAENYNKWRQREELQKLKAKYGNVEDLDLDESSSSSESEDEDAEALTSQLEKDWLCALAAVKTKNPKIYDQDVKFYHDEGEDKTEKGDDDKQKGKKTKEKDKPMYLKDYDRKVILEKGGHLSEESDSDVDKPPIVQYTEEQKELKDNLLAAVRSDDSDSDEEFLTKRTKTKEEEKKEEEDYLEWLKGHKAELGEGEQVAEELNDLKAYWNDPRIDEGEKFLRDYILNKRYLDEDTDRIPTYDEIVNDDFSEEEEAIEKQEEFERKYNFRYEEPDPEFIKSYPRTVDDSLRRKDNKRSRKRQEAKQRKALEKKKKKEELKQLKNLKKKEILSKLDQIKEITGNPSVAFKEEDVEGDFDPAEHDRRMQQIFGEDYYDDGVEDTKPVFEDDDDDLWPEENWDNWQGSGAAGEAGEAEEYYDEGEDFNMDADFDPSEDRSFGLDGHKHKKKKSKFAKAVERNKPVFDPNNKTFEEYFEEYYKLDYEDIVADVPCRFKYRQVVANDFGLTPEEILKCPDKELNSWVSLKKTTQYRTEEEEMFDVKIYKRKAMNERKKKNILRSLAEEPEEAAQQVHKDKSLPAKGKQDHSVAGSANQGWSDKPCTVTSDDQADLLHLKHTITSNDSKDLVVPKKKRKQMDSEDDAKPNKKHKLDNSSIKKDNSSKVNVVATVQVSQTSKSKKKKKKKQQAAKTSGGKGFLSSGLPHMSDGRMKAYGINPKKFKYTHGQKLAGKTGHR